VFIDEIEKAFAGTGTDLSGVKTEMTGTILTYMQDREADGIVFVGPAGAAKSAAAKATGGTSVRRQLFLLLDDNYFSLSTTITS
jgi:SpoVK/Ycf46/Vps4 family AAA+-type ATPase